MIARMRDVRYVRPYLNRSGMASNLSEYIKLPIPPPCVQLRQTYEYTGQLASHYSVLRTPFVDLWLYEAAIEKKWR